MLSADHEGAAGEIVLAINEIRTLPRAGMMVCCAPPASRDGRTSAAGGGAAEGCPASVVAAGWGTVPRQELDSNLESGTGPDNRRTWRGVLWFHAFTSCLFGGYPSPPATPTPRWTPKGDGCGLAGMGTLQEAAQELSSLILLLWFA